MCIELWPWPRSALVRAPSELLARFPLTPPPPSRIQTELASILKDYVGRANPLYFAERLTEHYGTADIYLKREDLNHTGAHKINHCLGEALLAKRRALLGER